MAAKKNDTALTSAKIGLLACQQNATVRSIKAQVVSCVETKKNETYKKWVENLKLKGDNWFAVELTDTVLFPAGGVHSQLADEGTIDGVEVATVQRNGLSAIHLVAKSFEVGKEVEVVVNWDVRFDHMQQHTGQHLLSAVVEGELKLPTKDVNFGSDFSSPSYIELEAETLDQKQLATIEEKVNAIISFNFPIVTWDVSADEAVSSKLIDKKDKVDGATYRIVTITAGKVEEKEGEKPKSIGVVDSCLCDGTHLSNVGLLHTLKLLHFEPRENKTLRLYFVAGDRTLSTLASTYARERRLVRLLQHRPENHAAVVQQLLHNELWLKQHHSAALEELRTYIAKDLVAKAKKEAAPKIFYHRDDATSAFLDALVKEVVEANPSALVVLSGGDRTSGGEAKIVIGSGDPKKLKAAVSAAAKDMKAIGNTKDKVWSGSVEDARQLESFEKSL